jgi:hypothetical protein
VKAPVRSETLSIKVGKAALLCDNSAATDLRGAIFAYIHSTSYVDQVLARAADYRAAAPAGGQAHVLVRPHPPHQLVGGGMPRGGVDRARAGGDSGEPLCERDVAGLSGGQQRLRRDTAGVHAGAPDRAAFDHHHRAAPYRHAKAWKQSRNSGKRRAEGS